MSGIAPVDPAEVPVFTGDLAELDKQVKVISSCGASVQAKASGVHTSFGGLQAFYQAPERASCSRRPKAGVGPGAEAQLGHVHDRRITGHLRA